MLRHEVRRCGNLFYVQQQHGQWLVLPYAPELLTLRHSEFHLHLRQGNFIPMSQWDRSNWPSHIHLPSEEELPVAPPLPAVAATAPAPVIDTAFPQSERDRILCAAALELINANPGQPSVRYLEMLLLSTHPDDCRAFIATASRRAFGQAVRRMPAEMKLQQGEHIGWRRIRDYLETARAITIAARSGDQTISLGLDYQSIRSSLPQISTNFIPFVQEAAGVFEQAQTEVFVGGKQWLVLPYAPELLTLRHSEFHLHLRQGVYDGCEIVNNPVDYSQHLGYLSESKTDRSLADRYSYALRMEIADEVERIGMSKIELHGYLDQCGMIGLKQGAPEQLTRLLEFLRGLGK